MSVVCWSQDRHWSKLDGWRFLPWLLQREAPTPSSQVVVCGCPPISPVLNEWAVRIPHGLSFNSVIIFKYHLSLHLRFQIPLPISFFFCFCSWPLRANVHRSGLLSSSLKCYFEPPCLAPQRQLLPSIPVPPPWWPDKWTYLPSKALPQWTLAACLAPVGPDDRR